MTNPLYGFFSAKAEEAFGSVVYSDPNGKEVVVTVVDACAEYPEYNWPDVVTRGPVTTFLRRHKRGRNSFTGFFDRSGSMHGSCNARC